MTKRNSILFLFLICINIICWVILWNVFILSMFFSSLIHYSCHLTYVSICYSWQYDFIYHQFYHYSALFELLANTSAGNKGETYCLIRGRSINNHGMQIKSLVIYFNLVLSRAFSSNWANRTLFQYKWVYISLQYAENPLKINFPLSKWIPMTV